MDTLQKKLGASRTKFPDMHTLLHACPEVQVLTFSKAECGMLKTSNHSSNAGDIKAKSLEF
jgi:hypothetical protein